MRAPRLPLPPGGAGRLLPAGLPRPAAVALVVLPLAWLLVVLGYQQVASSGGLLVFCAGLWLVFLACLAETTRQIWAGTVNLGLLLAAQTALWYSLPWTYLPLVDLGRAHLTMTEVRNLAELTTVILMVCLGTAALAACLPLRLRIDTDLSPGRQRAMLGLVLALCAIQAPLIATGYWGYANVTGGVRGARELPEAVQLLRSVTVAVPPMVALLLAAALRGGRSAAAKAPLLALLALVGLVQLMWFSTQSRRMMATVLFVSALLYYRNRHPGGIRPGQLPWILLAVGLMGAGLLVTWWLYYNMRVATVMMAGARNFSLLDLPEILQLASRMESDYGENVVSRPFLLLQSVQTVVTHARGTLQGWNLASQVLLSVPSFLFSDKLATIGPVREVLWTSALGVPLRDWSNTLLLEAYVDFGFLGFPLYVALITGVLKALDAPTRGLGGPLAALVYGLVVVVSMLNVESTIAAYLVMVRNVLILTVILLLARLAGGVLRPRHAAPSRPTPSRPAPSRPAPSRRPPPRHSPRRAPS